MSEPTQVSRDELRRLRELERRVRAMFGQSVPEQVTAAVAIAVSTSAADAERVEALARAASHRYDVNDKLIATVRELMSLVTSDATHVDGHRIEAALAEIESTSPETYDEIMREAYIGYASQVEPPIVPKVGDEAVVDLAGRVYRFAPPPQHFFRPDDDDVEAGAGFIDPRAAIGMPPEHRDWRWRALVGQPEALGFAPIIHPTAVIEAFVTVDSGLERPTFIGAHCFLMKHVHVGHDCQINARATLGAGAVLAGHVVVGEDTKVGIGVLVRPRVRIGRGCVIGAGAVVVRDVPDGEVWVGNPAHELGADERGGRDDDIFEAWAERDDERREA